MGGHDGDHGHGHDLERPLMDEHRGHGHGDGHGHGGGHEHGNGHGHGDGHGHGNGDGHGNHGHSHGDGHSHSHHASEMSESDYLDDEQRLQKAVLWALPLGIFFELQVSRNHAIICSCARSVRVSVQVLHAD